MFCGFYIDGTTMHFHNIIGSTQAKTDNLRPFFRRKERLHDLVLDVVRDAGAVVFNFNCYGFASFVSAYR